MKRIALALLLSCAALAGAQAVDNTLYVKQFPGGDVGTKLTNTMASCSPNLNIPCILVIDPSLAAWATGTLPPLCSRCFLLDYRDGAPPATSISGLTLAPGLPQAGLSSFYPMNEGSGTVAHDVTGNGNNCLFGGGGAAPTWANPSGITFNGSQYCTIGPGQDGWGTALVAYRVDPANATDGFPTLIGTAGTTGMLFALQQGGSGIGTLTMTSGSVANQSRSNQQATGVHVAAVTRNTQDRVFLDGLEANPYQTTGTTVATIPQVPFPAFQEFGNSGYLSGTGSGLIGTIYEIAIYSTILTTAQIQQATVAMQNDINARGVNFVPYPQTLSTRNQMVCTGDSITAGLNITTPFCSYAFFDSFGVIVTNDGIPGIGLGATLGLQLTREQVQYSPLAAKNVDAILLGTNGLSVTQSPNNMNLLCALIHEQKSFGYKVLVGTIPSKTGANCGDGNSCDAAHDTYNQLVRQGYKACGGDGLVDYAAWPNVGADGAYANSTYFQVDGIHPTQTAVTNYFKPTLNDALQALWPQTAAVPAIITASTYTLLYSDLYLTANPASNNIALTLPEAMGTTDLQFHVKNAQQAGVNTVTVGTTGGELIDGLSSIVVPNAGDVCLVDVVNSASTGGAHWEKCDHYPTYTYPVCTIVTPVSGNTGSGAGTSPVQLASCAIPAGRFPASSIMAITARFSACTGSAAPWSTCTGANTGSCTPKIYFSNSSTGTSYNFNTYLSMVAHESGAFRGDVANSGAGTTQTYDSDFLFTSAGGFGGGYYAASGFQSAYNTATTETYVNIFMTQSVGGDYCWLDQARAEVIPSP